MLSFETVEGASPKRNVLFLHGILGRGNNWRSIARRLVDANPDIRAVLVDLRMHGDSLDAEPPHTVVQCARDLVELEAKFKPRFDAVLGHSFGGKVAIAYAGHRAQRAQSDPLHALVLADSSPAPGGRGGVVADVLDALAKHTNAFPSRAAFVRALQEDGVSEPIARWLALNLRKTGSTVAFGPDLEVIEALLADYWGWDAWPAIGALRSERLTVIAGGDSDVLDDEALARLRTEGEVVVLEGAGHWVHVDAPVAFVAALSKALERTR